MYQKKKKKKKKSQNALQSLNLIFFFLPETMTNIYSTDDYYHNIHGYMLTLVKSRAVLNGKFCCELTLFQILTPPD